MSDTLHYTDLVRITVRRRAKGKCERCGERLIHRNGKNQQSMHHRHMRRDNGRDLVENMIHLCNLCHRHIHDNERWAVGFGWIVDGLPEVRPFLLHGQRWVLLTADGKYEDIHPDEAQELLAWQYVTEEAAYA